MRRRGIGTGGAQRSLIIPLSPEDRRMGWVFLEIVVVLLIAVAIVWWTLPKKPK
jgi:hypothetical protein